MPDDGTTGRRQSLEGVLEREYFRRQFQTLISRHRLDDVILLRVLADHYQHAANEAKNCRLSEAKTELLGLAEVELPAAEEIRLAASVAELPVRALIRWREGCHRAALEHLHAALDSCHVLASRWGHDYLTSRRVHFAGNVARVLVDMNDMPAASLLVEAVGAVIEGDKRRWPFSGSETLDVPLKVAERTVISAQLRRTAARLVHPAGFAGKVKG